MRQMLRQKRCARLSSKLPASAAASKTGLLELLEQSLMELRRSDITPALIIEHGAVFDGKCHMLENKNNVTKDFTAAEHKTSVDTSNLKRVDAI